MEKREITVVVESIIHDIAERYDLSYVEAEKLLKDTLLEFKVESFIMSSIAEKLM